MKKNMKLSSTIKKILSKGRAWVALTLIFCMGFGMVTTSCEDMLQPDSERHAYTVAQDTLYSYWGVLKSLQGIAERYVVLSECRADLLTGTSSVSDTIAAILNFGQNGYQDKYQDGSCMYLKASDYYHVINSCNAYIARCDTMRTTGMDEKYMIKEYAQVEAIRAWVYMQLVLAYGEVPFYLDPKLTSDDINKFMNDPNHQTANANNLADLLADRLIPMEYVEKRYEYPQYLSYGQTNAVCHSEKCMFPVSIVLGDLYLMKGDDASCAKAAQCYYNYLNTKRGGPIIGDSYYCRGYLSENEDEPFYSHLGTPWTETGAVTKGTEAITCIPSNRGKLDGRVFTSINRLFGFEASLSVSTVTNDDVEGDNRSYISLTRNFDRELVASKGYEALCDSQKYEVYLHGTYNDPMGLHTDENGNQVPTIAVLPDVGDARQYWNVMYSDRVGDDTFYGRFVTKQNPNGGYTTVFPMIYRKATIWLRFAEAINRAGFPSYAFAILKNGLCNNDAWFPDSDNPYEIVDDTLFFDTTFVNSYAVKSTKFVYVKDSTDMCNEGGVKVGVKYTMAYQADTKEDLQAILDAKLAAGDIDTIIAAQIIEYPTAFNNRPTDDCQAICYYLNRREVADAENTPYLNFNTLYLRSNIMNYPIDYKQEMYDRLVNNSRYPQATTDYYITTGIHSRGCGRLAYNERYGSYNYVEQVIKKVKENTGTDITEDVIYQDTPDPRVIEAVEDLIVDEMGLELAFEGTRFFDLSRVARRRNSPAYFAKHVAKRNGEMDMTLYNYLSQSEKNWYLPLPKNQ